MVRINEWKFSLLKDPMFKTHAFFAVSWSSEEITEISNCKFYPRTGHEGPEEE